MKLISPEAREAKASRAFRPQTYAEAIRERQLAPYERMECGHLTTREEIEAYSVWQTKKGRWYCTNCGRWRNKAKPPKREPLPDEPMF